MNKNIDESFDFGHWKIKDVAELCRSFAYCEDCPLSIERVGMFAGMSACMLLGPDIRPSDWTDIDDINRNLDGFFGVEEENK